MRTESTHMAHSSRAKRKAIAEAISNIIEKDEEQSCTTLAQDLGVPWTEVRHLRAAEQDLKPRTAYRLFLTLGWDYDQLLEGSVKQLGTDRADWDARLENRDDLIDALAKLATQLHRETLEFYKGGNLLKRHLPLVYLVEVVSCILRFKELAATTNEDAPRSDENPAWLDGRAQPPPQLPVWLRELRDALKNATEPKEEIMQKSILGRERRSRRTA